MDDRDIVHDSGGDPEDYRTLRPIRDDRRQLSRPHLLSPRRASDTTLPPLHMLQSRRRGSVTDPSLHATGSASFRPLDLSRRSLDSPQHIPNHLPSSLHGEYAHTDRAAGPHPPPVRHWSHDEVHVNRMDIDEPDRSVRPRRKTLPNHLTPLLEPATPREPPTSGVGHKRKMSLEDVHFPRSAEEEGVSSRTEHATTLNIDSSLPSLKRRGSVATQHMAHLSIHDRRDSLDSPPSETQGGSQWWRHSRSDSNASTNTFAQPPPPFNSEPSRGPPPAGMAPFAWPSRPLPPGHSHMQSDADAHIVQSHRSSYYTSSPPGPPPPMPPPYGHDRRMSAPSGMPAHSPGSVERTLRSRSRPASRSSEQAVTPIMGEATHTLHHVGDTDDSGGSAGPQSKPLTPYSRSPELRVSHKLAERKRRKEMKDLFDELRDQLPADRGMKSSKWEILSKAVDYISSMKRTQQEMSREIEVLRQELDSVRKFASSGGPIPGPSTFTAYGPTPASPTRAIHTTATQTGPASPPHVSHAVPALLPAVSISVSASGPAPERTGSHETPGLTLDIGAPIGNSRGVTPPS